MYNSKSLQLAKMFYNDALILLFKGHYWALVPSEDFYLRTEVTKMGTPVHTGKTVEKYYCLSHFLTNGISWPVHRNWVSAVVKLRLTLMVMCL